MESRTPALPALPPPPGAIATLVKGFNAIAGNVVVILFPAVLDMFLWLGPRLKADALLAPFLQAMPPDIQAQVPADQLKIVTQFITDFQNGLNLFSVLRTFPLGVFSLMSTSLALKSPLGLRAALAMPNWLAAFAAILFLTLLGWLAGSLYFHSVAKVTTKEQDGPGLLRVLLQSLLLSIVWIVLFTIANLPLFILLALVSMLDSLLRTILFILVSVPVAWVLLVIFYSFFGIFANAQNAFKSTRSSIHMLRYGLPPLGWFTMLVILISQGMDTLWRAAPTDSWMMGVGILGHAFISTSLLAASFIYYRELNLWIETVLQVLKKQNKSSVQA